MSLTLNLSSSVATKKKLQRHKYADKISEPIVEDDRFTFSLSKSISGKGFAIRRKNLPIVKNKVKLETKPILSAEKRHVSPEKSSTVFQPQRNYVMATKNSDTDNDNSDDNKDSGIELALNISESAIDPRQLKRKKLAREERKNAKRVERRLKLNKVLTKQEIDEGIKKFSTFPLENPFSRPRKKRALDIPETKLIGQRAVKPRTETIFTGKSVSEIGLHPHSVKNLADLMNITELTTVQLKAIPKALEGFDLLVRSQTGSGKTLAYALPVVQKLQEIRPKLTRMCGIRAVVIVPTRELAIQTYEVFLKLLKPFTWIVAGYLTGGEKRKSEKARLRKGINILVGTPGRLVDHLLHTETLKLDKTQFLILDEGDRIYEMGYERDVKQIVEGINDHKAGKFTVVKEQPKTPKNPFHVSKVDEESIEKEVIQVPGEVSNVKLQTMLLSATLTSAVQKLAGLALKDPVFIDTSDKEVLIPVDTSQYYVPAVPVVESDEKLVIPAKVALSFLVVPPKLRLVTLSSIFATAAAKGNLKAIVIMATTEMVDYHHSLLMECLTEKVLDDEDEKRESDSEDEEPALLKGVNIFRLHGSMDQTERTGVFRAFQKCKQGILLATDVVGRGIDIIKVDLVIQYSPPENIAEFVHRVGRTARAGRSGEAILFVGPSETEFIRKLEEKRIRISQGEIEKYLKALEVADDKAHTAQEAASNLQHKFELLVEEDEEIKKRAYKAYVSWVRSYSSFPRDLKPIFNLNDAHMGHYAKSFALRDAPKSFARKHSAPKPQLPKNRLTYTERDPEKIKFDKREKKRKREGPSIPGREPLSEKFIMLLAKNKTFNTSEFDSGMPETKKRKKNRK